jgi:glycosyltransferase involved in cell wall biosynthesis
MPKILRIHNRLIVGGPTLNVLYLTKYLSPEFETLLVVGEKEDHEKDASYLAKEMGIDTLVVPDMGRSIDLTRDYRSYRQLRRIIKKFQPDIVHTHSAKPGAVGRMAASAMNVPAIVHTYHGHVFHSYFNKFKSGFFVNTERFLARRTSAIVAISEQQKKELSRDFKIADEKKFRVIPLGFELKKFGEDQEKKRKSFRQEFGLADDEIAIGIIGRLVPVKNHLLFLDGIDYVLRHTTRKIRAFIIGDGETRRALEERASQLGIRHHAAGDMPSDMQSEFIRSTPADVPLVFTSWRSDIDVINAGLDIIALTSLNEGTPVSLIEAQAANRPIVSTRVGGIADIVIENETALLSNPNDKKAFGVNMLKLVEDDEWRVRLGRLGAEHVSQKFSAERLAADMASLYRELLNGPKKRK